MDQMVRFNAIRKYVHKKKLSVSLEVLPMLSMIIEDILESACHRAKVDDSRRLCLKHFKNIVVKLHD